MRQKFLKVSTARQARALAPWAAKIVKLLGGYMVFESIADYRRWAAQK